MSQRINGQAVICQEPERQCGLCGRIAECRPYGPNGEQVCFDCGMKDEEAAKRQFRRLILGESVQ